MNNYNIIPSFVIIIYNVYIVTYINTNLPAGTEQTALNVIAWVRSQVYRHSTPHAGVKISSWLAHRIDSLLKKM